MSQAEKLVSPCELAERLRISTFTLARMRSEKRGPAYMKVGGSVRYRESDIAEYFAKSAVKPSQ